MSDPGMPAAVEMRGVAKRFRREGGGRGMGWHLHRRRPELVALHPLDLTLARGTTTGIIGPNGSGKSTLVRILATLVLPDSGRARVFGHDVVSDSFSVRRHVNRVSVEAAFFKELSAWENLLYAARIYGSADGRLRGRAEDALGRFGLRADVLDRPLRHLSRGQQQKIAIARSVLTTPALLLMDEPTTGLDPRSKREVQQMVAELRDDSVTTLLCTHDMDEAEALCDRVLLMDRGRVLADGTPGQHRLSGRRTRHLVLRGGLPPSHRRANPDGTTPPCPQGGLPPPAVGQSPTAQPPRPQGGLPPSRRRANPDGTTPP